VKRQPRLGVPEQKLLERTKLIFLQVPQFIQWV